MTAMDIRTRNTNLYPNTPEKQKKNTRAGTCEKQQKSSPVTPACKNNRGKAFSRNSNYYTGSERKHCGFAEIRQLPVTLVSQQGETGFILKRELE